MAKRPCEEMDVGDVKLKDPSSELQIQGRKRLSDASGSTVVLGNCHVKKARCSDEYYTFRECILSELQCSSLGACYQEHYSRKVQ